MAKECSSAKDQVRDIVSNNERAPRTTGVVGGGGQRARALQSDRPGVRSGMCYLTFDRPRTFMYNMGNDIYLSGLLN